MVSFRKAFLLLAALVTLASLVSAQPATCTAFTSNVPNVRSEGLAEEAGQIVIECRGGLSKAYTPTSPALSTINVQVFLNANVTSRRTVGNGSAETQLEALLLIDEPTQAETSTAKTCAAFADCPAYPAGDGGKYRSSLTAAPGTGYNAFQGRLLAANSVIWTGVPFDAPGTTPVRTLRITNIRANINSAFGFGTAGSLPSELRMFVSISGTAAPNITNSNLVVGLAQRGLQFSSTNSGDSYLQCEPSDGSTAKTFEVRFRERFPTAFRNAPGYDTAPASVNQSDLGLIYNTEHMYANPNLNDVVGLGATAGRGTQPTRLMATFTGLPTNVLLRFPRVITYVPPSGAADTLTYIQCFDTTGTSCSNAILGSPTNVDVTPVGGTATLVFEMVDANPATQSDFKIPVTLRWGPITNGIAGPPGIGTVNVNGSYAPVSTQLGSRTAPAPRFVQNPEDLVSFSINPCRTNLLFPYVTNQGGFDTGLVISNTSADKFGTVPQNGSCALEYYGNTDGTGAAPGGYSTETIAAGTQLIGSVGLGGNLGLQATKGFGGYIIARCNFQYAHGFAYLFKYTGVSFDGTMGYLALVLDASDPNKTRTGSVSEGRGQ